MKRAILKFILFTIWINIEKSIKRTKKPKIKNRKTHPKSVITKCQLFIYIIIFIIIFLLITLILKRTLMNNNNNNEKGNKRKIYVQYIDFWPSFKIKKFDVHNILKEKYDVVITEKNPDYLFFGQFGTKHKEIGEKYDCIKIFFTIEDTPPNFSTADYSIGIHYLKNGDRYFRRPTGTGMLSEYYSVYNVNKKNGIDSSFKLFD